MKDEVIDKLIREEHARRAEIRALKKEYRTLIKERVKQLDFIRHRLIEPEKRLFWKGWYHSYFCPHCGAEIPKKHFVDGIHTGDYNDTFNYWKCPKCDYEYGFLGGRDVPD